MHAQRTAVQRRSYLTEYRINRTSAKVGSTKGCAPRPASIRALGCILHPEAVTARWHAGGCDPRHIRRRGLSRRVMFQWRIACALRGVEMPKAYG